MLLEGLIAILIFSLGILAVVGMQAMAVKQVSDAQYRSQANLLVNQLLGTMWVSDRKSAALQSRFSSDGVSEEAQIGAGDGYNAWLTSVSSTLPGVAENPPTVHVSGTGLVTVTVYWLAPNEPPTVAPHKYVSVAQITPST